MTFFHLCEKDSWPFFFCSFGTHCIGEYVGELQLSNQNATPFCFGPVEVNGSSQKRSMLPPQRKFVPFGGGGYKSLFLIIVSVLGHPKEVGGLT